MWKIGGDGEIHCKSDLYLASVWHHHCYIKAWRRLVSLDDLWPSHLCSFCEDGGDSVPGTRCLCWRHNRADCLCETCCVNPHSSSRIAVFISSTITSSDRSYLLGNQLNISHRLCWVVFTYIVWCSYRTTPLSHHRLTILECCQHFLRDSYTNT